MTILLLIGITVAGILITYYLVTGMAGIGYAGPPANLYVENITYQPITSVLSSNRDYWFDPDWKYRKEVIISGSSTDLSNFQVRVQLDNTNFDFSKANPDGSDIRFTDSDGTTPIPYWIEEWDQSNQRAVIWVKVPKIPAGGSTTIYMYYGNSSATDAGDGNAVFEFFDDFEGASLSSNWLAFDDPEIEVKNSVLTISPSINPRWQYIYTSNSFDAPYAAEFKARFSGKFASVLWHRQSNGSFYVIQVNPNENRWDFGWYDAEKGRYKHYQTYGSPSLTWSRFALVVRASDVYDHYEDYAVEGILVGDRGWTKGSFGFGVFSPNSDTCQVDYFFVRKYADPEPTIHFGEEQTMGAGVGKYILVYVKNVSGVSAQISDVYIKAAYSGVEERIPENELIFIRNGSRVDKGEIFPGETLIVAFKPKVVKIEVAKEYDISIVTKEGGKIVSNMDF